MLFVGTFAVFALALVGLGGCAGWTPDDGAPPGMTVTGDDHVVRVATQWPGGDLQSVAEAYCTSRGKLPRLHSMAPNSVVYDCLAPGSEAAR